MEKITILLLLLQCTTLQVTTSCSCNTRKHLEEYCEQETLPLVRVEVEKIEKSKRGNCAPPWQVARDIPVSNFYTTPTMRALGNRVLCNEDQLRVKLRVTKTLLPGHIRASRVMTSHHVNVTSHHVSVRKGRRVFVFTTELGSECEGVVPALQIGSSFIMQYPVLPTHHTADNIPNVPSFPFSWCAAIPDRNKGKLRSTCKKIRREKRRERRMKEGTLTED